MFPPVSLVSQVAECCKGFYGPDCKPCIGGFQHPCYDKGTVSDNQTAPLSRQVAFLRCFILCVYPFTSCSALMVSKATAHAAVSQTSRVSPVTSVWIHPSTETTVMKVAVPERPNTCFFTFFTTFYERNSNKNVDPLRTAHFTD